MSMNPMWAQFQRLVRLPSVLLGLVLGATFPGAMAAQQQVVGQVQDSSTRRPIPGVRVQVVGTRASAFTDAGGRFVLEVPAGGDSLSFTYIGYRPVKTGVQSSITISMLAQAMRMDEIVVTALGIEREQGDLPYAAQSVPSAKLTDVPASNLVSSLQGNIAGVHVTNSGSPFGSARVVVRGASSILGQNQPLFVVDGVPIDNSAASLDGYGGGSMAGYDVGNAAGEINANNIESMTVLKGPNAAALYGARAANGAIVITTKKGADAPGGGGFGVTASFGTTFQRPLRLPDYQNQYGQGFYGEFDFVDGNGGGINDFADESWGPKLDGRTHGCVYNAAGTAYDMTKPCQQFFGAGAWQAHPDNVSKFWEMGAVTNVNMAVARAGDRSNVRLSVGRTDENGMYPNNTNNRTDLTLAGGAQISDRWSAEASINYINNTMTNQPAQAYNDSDPMQGFIWFGRQVDVRMLKDSLYRDPNSPLTQQILAGNPNLRTDAPLPYSWNYSYHPNPYWSAGVKTTDYARNRGLGHASVTFKVADWINVTARTGRDWYQSHLRANYPVNNIDPNPQGGFDDVGETRSETNSDFLISANRSLFSGLDISVNAGGNARVSGLERNRANVSQLVIPGVYTLENSDGQPDVTLYKENKKVNSLYGSASFNYKGWFNLDITGRNDWSSTLPVAQNSFFYPSFGGAFIFTEALGLQNRFLSYGKLRASWTRVGNDTDPYRLAAVYQNGALWAGQPSFAAPSSLPNPDLKPEETTGQELGADLGFLDSRLTLNATWYQKITENQILPVSISQASGASSAVVNSGSVRNRGFEIAATIKPINTPTFRWDIVANWSKNTNKVLSLYSGVQRIVVGTYWNVSVTADSGQPYGNLVGRKWQRDGQNRIIVGANGLPLRDPALAVLGNYSPDWVGGITNAFTYKGVSLSFGFDGQMGGNVYSVTKWFGQYSGVLSATLLGRENDWDDGFVVPNSVRANGTANTTTVLSEDYWHNTFFAQEEGIIDASYLKLREARLAVILPRSVARRMGFSEASIALVGRNLLLWAKQKTIDPETTFDTGNRQGVENGQLPTARSLGFTVSVRP
jgi:TonB-linked SusC/RagA family outer membrane protein